MREEEMESKDGVSHKVGFFILRRCVDMLAFPPMGLLHESLPDPHPCHQSLCVSRLEIL